MNNCRLFLIAGGTGSGKSYLVENARLPDDISVFNYDHLMHDAALCAFPYAKGGELRWTKEIWESTKSYIDAEQAMLRTIHHQLKYQRHAESQHQKFVVFGYQLADEYWINTATFIVRELTQSDPNVHLCWLNPTVDAVIAQRKSRGNEHDCIGVSELRAEYNRYVQKMGHKFNSRHSDSTGVIDEAKHFFGIA